MKNIYSKILVILQFGSIGAMLFASYGSHFLPLSAIIIFFIGLSIGIWALMHNKLGNFNIRPDLKEGSTLVNTGIYRLIRHPMYTSVMLMALSILIASPTLLESILFLFLVIVLFLKASREEELWREHDETYDIYKKQTKYFIPYIL